MALAVIRARRLVTAAVTLPRRWHNHNHHAAVETGTPVAVASAAPLNPPDQGAAQATLLRQTPHVDKPSRLPADGRGLRDFMADSGKAGKDKAELPARGGEAAEAPFVLLFPPLPPYFGTDFLR